MAGDSEEIPAAATDHKLAEEDAPAPVEAAEAEIEGDKGEVGQEEYVVEEDAEPDEVAVLLCILNQDGDVMRGRKIWRRIAVPTDFSLLELHVALQNAFDWEDTHLHAFSQPRQLSSSTSIPAYLGFGRTDISAFPLLDLDSFPSEEIRSFKAVVGVKDEAIDTILTRAEVRQGAEVKGKEGEGQKDTVEVEGEGGEEGSCLVFVEHSHPHAEPDPPPVDRNPKLETGPSQVLEERAFFVGGALTKENPLLIYEYDFRVNYEVHVFFEGKFEATEGVNYPTCLAGSGASPAEDGDDMDDEGNLLPSYSYEDFAVLDVLANFEKTYEDSWPAGPGADETADVARCYMCRYNRECGRRRECSGKCCSYCLKRSLLLESGRLSLPEADAIFLKAAQKISDARKSFVEGGTCTWVEEDGQPCAVCA